MHDPAAIWSSRLVVFDKEISNTQNAILSQASTALSSTIDLIRNLRALINVSPIKNFYISDPPYLIPSTLSNLCYQAGLASTILFDDCKKKRSESSTSYKLRIERVAYVKKWCATRGLKTPTLENRSMRNALTHIDEYMADALTKEGSTGWWIDSALKSRAEFMPPAGIKMQFCRSYVNDEDKLLHLDKELSLKSLEEECSALLAVVFGVPIKKTSLLNHLIF